MQDKEFTSIPAIERAFQVLEFIGELHRPVILKEVSDALGIPGASCFRILKSLVNCGYLNENPTANHQYTLGYRVLRLAELFSEEYDLKALSAAPMERLSKRLNQTVLLGIYSNDSVIYIANALPSGTLGTLVPLNTPIPPNACACGKVLLSNISQAKLSKLIDAAHFEQLTEHTIMDKERFTQELDKVYHDSFARDLEEYAPGIGSIAVPIYDYLESNVGALCISGRISDYEDPKKHIFYLSELARTAMEISLMMGYKDT